MKSHIILNTAEKSTLIKKLEDFLKKLLESYNQITETVPFYHYCPWLNKKISF